MGDLTSFPWIFYFNIMKRGRKPKLTPEIIERIQFLYARTNMNVAAIGRNVGVSPVTAARALEMPLKWKVDENTPNPTNMRVRNHIT
jgi:hypothetical protein